MRGGGKTDGQMQSDREMKHHTAVSVQTADTHWKRRMSHPMSVAWGAPFITTSQSTIGLGIFLWKSDVQANTHIPPRSVVSMLKCSIFSEIREDDDLTKKLTCDNYDCLCVSNVARPKLWNKKQAVLSQSGYTSHHVSNSLRTVEYRTSMTNISQRNHARFAMQVQLTVVRRRTTRRVHHSTVWAWLGSSCTWHSLTYTRHCTIAASLTTSPLSYGQRNCLTYFIGQSSEQ